MAAEELTESRILIVDDNALNVEQLESLLEVGGFMNQKSTRDPREVERLVGEFDPDLVLLDLMMPHLDGFQVMERLREMLPPGSFLPIIVLTADVTRQSRERALGLGAIDFLTKPFNHAEVLLRVRNHLRTRSMHLMLEQQNQVLDAKVAERTRELEETLDDLRRTQDELVAQERLKAMGQMASGIAHDFNNAVSIVLGHAELLQQFPELARDPSRVADSLDTICTAARDATSVVRRLREFYRTDNEDSESTSSSDVKEVAANVVSLTQPRWKSQAQAEGRQIKIVTDLAPAHVRMGESKLREILTNLVFNAVDAMPKGGEISIRSREEGRCGVIEVRDTGTGMTEEVRAHCLEPFYSTKGKKGTGLGLGVVNSTVKQSHGRIDIESEPGVGTTFVIRLPLAVGDIRAEEADERGRLKRSLNILLVDDEEDVLSTEELMLRRDGHTVVTARDGQEGLSKFLSDYFDLVITDQAMPAVNGEQLARAIRSHASDKPIVMLTGFADQMRSEGSVPADVSVLLNKPAHVAEIRRTLLELFAPGHSPGEGGEGRG